jgi:MYXO-CTERM domain-containing protein
VRVPEESADVCGYDQALVILQDSVDGVTPYVPRIDIEPLTDEPYTAVGYGQTSDTGWSGGSRMELGGLVVKCGAGECSFGGIQSTEFLGDTGVCQGDSGGPALDANGKVIGVVSRGAQGCQSPVYGAVSAWKDWIMKVAIEAATKGNYQPPFWALSGKSDPESGTAGTGGEGGGSGGGSTSTGGSSSSGNAQGQSCSATVGCPSGFQCLNAEKPYCAAVCSASAPCGAGTSCNSLGVCENSAAPNQAKSSSDSGGGCSISAGAGPVKPVPWIVGLAMAVGATFRRRRRS